MQLRSAVNASQVAPSLELLEPAAPAMEPLEVPQLGSLAGHVGPQLAVPRPVPRPKKVDKNRSARVFTGRP